MDEDKDLKLANIIMQILYNRPSHNQKITNQVLLHIVRGEGDNTMQLSVINYAVLYLEDKGAVMVDRYGGTPTSAFDYVKISKSGIAKIYENRRWPMPKASERASKKLNIVKKDLYEYF